MSYIEYVSSSWEDENPMPDLARANHFTMNDLEQNRQGKISDQQMGRLFVRAWKPLRYTGGALIGWLIFCFIVNTLVPDIVFLIATLVAGKSIAALFGVITGICVLAVIVSAVKSGRRVTLLLQDLSKGKAAFTDGRVSVSREEEKGIGMAQLRGEKHENCWYVVQNEYFEVEEEAGAALPPGRRWRLYHTPRSRLLLSIEPVPAG